MHTVRDRSTSAATRALIALLAAFALVMALVPESAQAVEPPADVQTSVIVREAPGAGTEPEQLVARLGGTVGQTLDLIGGFAAMVPAHAIGALTASPYVLQVTPNAVLELSEAGWEDAATLAPGDPQTSPSSLYEVARYMRADKMWDSGYTGAGIDVALIDSGVVPVNGLTRPGKVFNGPDLSFESQYDSLRYLDTFGHGTHMAGIIAGRDDEASSKLSKEAEDDFVGIAPDARIVSVKVADAQGVTDVSQVIAAIDWVVEHRRDAGLNIRVLNLSFGTDSKQSYVLDPLAYAVEKAWDAGIVVVVAAGNDGNSQPLRNPALDPFVIAVGAADPMKTKDLTDDVVSSFSNCGTSQRSVDIVAHGRSITSLRAPGSYADVQNPDSVVADRLFVGSGTSQAAAAVSGAVALLLDENPKLNPDQVKSILTSEAAYLGRAKPICQGAGAVDVHASAKASVPSAEKVAQGHEPSNGGGLIDDSRGSDRLSADGVVLKGEQDIMGNPWIGFNEVVVSCKTIEATTPIGVEPVELEPVVVDPVVVDPVALESVEVELATVEPISLASAEVKPILTEVDDDQAEAEEAEEEKVKEETAVGDEVDDDEAELVPVEPEPEPVTVCEEYVQPADTLWDGGDWNGATWSGATWSGATWSGATWSGATWSGATWSGATWSGATWSGATWSGATWSGATWSGATWSGATWSGATWSGSGWLGLTWH